MAALSTQIDHNCIPKLLLSGALHFVLLTLKTHSAILLAISLHRCQLPLCEQNMPTNKMYEVIFQMPLRRYRCLSDGHA